MKSKVKLIKSQKIYSGNISLRLDKFKLNSKIIEKEIVEHLPSIGVIPVLNNTDILFVTQYRHAVGKNILEIPAGKIERDETAEQAALREMREEIGYTGKLSPVMKWYLAPGYDTELMHIFVATNLRKIKKRSQDLDDDENIIVKRIRYTSAIKKCINGEFQDAKTVAAILVYAKILETDGTFT
jgi:ADP-ribose pyrophosphatase